MVQGALGRVATARSHWIIACDANMEPMQFRSGECYSEAHVKALAGGVSTYRTVGAGKKDTCKVLDYCMLGESLDNTFENIDVVEEFGPKPHKLVRCEIKLTKGDKMV